MSRRPRFAILGTGNSGQAFAADLTLKGYEVHLAELPNFADTLHAIERRGGIEISGDAATGFARPKLLTTDLEAALEGVHILIFGGSAFAHEPWCRAVAPYLRDGQYILFTSNFGALRFRQWQQEWPIRADVTPVEAMSLIYATRAPEPGRVVVIGVKSHLPAAALPATRTPSFLELMKPAFPALVAAENVLFTSLNNLNPIVHPPMVLCNAGRIEATGGQGWNLYQEGATASVTRLMEALDADRRALMQRVGLKSLAFKEAFGVLYRDYGVEKETLEATLRESPIHSDPAFPAPAQLDTRYLTEDISFGLVPWAALARMWQQPTPTLDATIQLASVLVGRNYWDSGLLPEHLGLAGMAPEEVLAWVR
ncbi:opine dehydrogenase [Desulfacinum hydrothermale DSM 13146]|uniref:Opine dehydrogenase n=1 Tax=Desulfacinum hydrothermale DSM 13146 TaxID=1121390 RepID=A0A1W1XFE7_9BACT|nr:NAD/NADP-dependent octopine/nopaline dehydrogenase family protein [Desulfacinum hydrothermale]SMC22542.1 opine dehydrogenase [Desulfacinum hydrothermale DSM 13146]